MAVSDAHVFPCFLTPVLTQLFFPKPRLLFSHASAEVWGENTVHLNRRSNSQPPGHESDTLTTELPGLGNTGKIKDNNYHATAKQVTAYSHLLFLPLNPFPNDKS